MNEDIKLVLPMIRKIVPKLLTMEMLSVQPMQETKKIFSIKEFMASNDKDFYDFELYDYLSVDLGHIESVHNGRQVLSSEFAYILDFVDLLLCNGIIETSKHNSNQSFDDDYERLIKTDEYIAAMRMRKKFLEL